jgi:ElaB/YqjD/DUF883 family membrane-anchored ribosome-binding protein
MAATALERLTGQPSTFRQFATGARRQALQAAREARMLKTVAQDAVEARMYEAAHRIRKQPLKAVAVAFAIGIPFGALIGWMGGRSRKPVRD